MTAYSSARIYYELFDGVAGDDRITDLVMRIRVGGTEAPLAGDRYRVSVYGRRHINGANLVTLHQENINLPDIGSVGLDESWRYWRTVDIDCANIDDDPVRCLVVKVEALLADPSYTKQNADYVPAYADQSTTADPPPWGIRITKAQVWASPLRRDVTPERVVEHICSPWWSGDQFFCPDESGVTCDQLVFEHIPKTRLSALNEVDTLLDWDFEVVRGAATYRKPVALGQARDDELYVASLSQPELSGSITPDMDDCYRGVRVVYTNKNERPKEIIEWADSEFLGDQQRAKVRELPEAVRSKKQAQRYAKRLAAGHAEPPIAGSWRFVKRAPVASGETRDALMIRPGELLRVQDAPRTYRKTEREISRVTLLPLEHTAEVELGPRSRKIERVLARMETRRPRL